MYKTSYYISETINYQDTFLMFFLSIAKIDSLEKLRNLLQQLPFEIFLKMLSMGP